MTDIGWLRAIAGGCVVVILACLVRHPGYDLVAEALAGILSVLLFGLLVVVTRPFTLVPASPAERVPTRLAWRADPERGFPLPLHLVVGLVVLVGISTTLHRDAGLLCFSCGLLLSACLVCAAPQARRVVVER